MRLYIQVEDDDNQAGGQRRFLMPLPDEADVRQLRDSIRSRLEPIPGVHHAHDRRLILLTAEGYQIDVCDADRVTDLIAADAVLFVRSVPIAADPDQIVTRLETLADDEHRWRALIGLVVLPPTPAVAERALASLSRALTSETRLGQFGAFVVEEAARRDLLGLLLDVRPEFLARLRSPALIEAAVRAVLDCDDGLPAPLVVLCRAWAVAPGANVRDTIRSLAKVAALRPHLSRLVRDHVPGLLPGAAVAVTVANPDRATWSVPDIESMTETQFDRQLHQLLAEADPGRLRTFTKAAMETRFGPHMAADSGLIAALSGHVRDGHATWAARLLGLLDRHGRRVISDNKTGRSGC